MDLCDKISEMSVIGCLMHNPLHLSEVDKYHFDVRDFSSLFTRSIFSSIQNLYLDGARTIQVIDIDSYIQRYPDLRVEFEKNQGVTYLQDCEDMGEDGNFPYYYSRLRKFSCLRSLDKDGFDISQFYPTNVLDKDYSDKMKQFDEMTVNEIFDGLKKKLFSLEEGYVSKASSTSGYIADGMRALKEQLKQSPEIGFPLQGKYYNTVVRGARKGKYYLRSAASGVGKTRLAVGDACNLAYPIYFDWNTREWVDKHYSEKVLFITTELDETEIQTLVQAWISGVDEEKILTGRYTFQEEYVVDEAINIAEKYKDNFIFHHIPDPSIEEIESAVRKEVLVNGVENVFYDYIFSSPSLLKEFQSAHIREDVALMMLSTSLKDLAVELGVFMQSATQITGRLEEAKGIRDQNYIRGSKAIADKADVGIITVTMGKEEKDIIEPIIVKLGLKMPNTVTDVYKVRRSKLKNTKIWSYVDLSTCRVEDIIITDGYYNPLENVRILTFEECVDRIVEEQFPPETEETPEENHKRKLSELF